MKLLALTGKAGSGKDTVADHLCEQHGYVRYEFARPLKAMLRAIGVDANDRDAKELPHKVFGASPRRMAQTLGTEWGRALICDDIWLRCASEFIKTTKANNEFDPTPYLGIVITDCRFPNESEFVRKNGASVWHIRRPGVAEVAKHVSESGVTIERHDQIIDNDSSMKKLFDQVDILIRCDAE